LAKRGPTPSQSDAALTAAVRDVIAASPFHGEGHRKIWARLRTRGLRTSKHRTLAVMRTAECVGLHAAKYGTRFEALEPVRQGVRDHFEGMAAGVATGLTMRHDHGSQ